MSQQTKPTTDLDIEFAIIAIICGFILGKAMMDMFLVLLWKVSNDTAK